LTNNDHVLQEIGSIMQYLYKQFVSVYKHVRSCLEML